MTVQVALVSMGSVWMALIVTAASARQDSQVTLLFVGCLLLQPHHFGKRASKEKVLFKYFLFLCLLES